MRARCSRCFTLSSEVPTTSATSRVVTTGANADLGRASGAQITLVSKSGTNELHGSMFEFLRNNVLDANGYFRNRAGQRRDALRRMLALYTEHMDGNEPVHTWPLP